MHRAARAGGVHGRVLAAGRRGQPGGQLLAGSPTCSRGPGGGRDSATAPGWWSCVTRGVRQPRAAARAASSAWRGSAASPDRDRARAGPARLGEPDQPERLDRPVRVSSHYPFWRGELQASSSTAAARPGAGSTYRRRVRPLGAGRDQGGRTWCHRSWPAGRPGSDGARRDGGDGRHDQPERVHLPGTAHDRRPGTVADTDCGCGSRTTVGTATSPSGATARHPLRDDPHDRAPRPASSTRSSSARSWSTRARRRQGRHRHQGRPHRGHRPRRQPATSATGSASRSGRTPSRSSPTASIATPGVVDSHVHLITPRSCRPPCRRA